MGLRMNGNNGFKSWSRGHAARGGGGPAGVARNGDTRSRRETAGSGTQRDGQPARAGRRHRRTPGETAPACATRGGAIRQPESGRASIKELQVTNPACPLEGALC